MDKSEKYSDEQLFALLKWQHAAGADICVGEQPLDRFAQSEEMSVLSNVAGKMQSNPVSRLPASSRGADAETSETLADPKEARALAESAKDLGELRALLEGYQGCGLRLRATQLVFGDGDGNAEIMLVGEAPGRDEDLQGRPFVGRSGQLLDRMLKSIGLLRENVYIANTVPWRPPGNRTPSPLEISLCLPFLQRQVELVAPKILVTLGAAATQTIFDAKLSILKVRGQWRDVTIGAHQVRALPTLHPAFLLRQPVQKRKAWHDMLEIGVAMKEMGLSSGKKIS